LQQLQTFQPIDPNETTAQKGFDMIHFVLVGGSVPEYQLLSDLIENPVFPYVFEREQQSCIGGEMPSCEFNAIDHVWLLSRKSAC
jgi:hypothetical protein